MWDEAGGGGSTYLQTEPWRTESSQAAGMELYLYPAARNAEPLWESRRAINPMADKASSCHEGGLVRQGCTLAWECQGPLAVLRAQCQIGRINKPKSLPQAAESEHPGVLEPSLQTKISRLGLGQHPGGDSRRFRA